MEDEDEELLDAQEAFDAINRTINAALGDKVFLCEDGELLADLEQINDLLAKVLGLD